MEGSLVADLAVDPEVWLFLTFLSCLTIFFKFSRFWSIRNLDLFLLFALAPGMMMLVGARGAQPWIAYVWLFMGSLLWIARCLLDLGLNRRPLLEPNLNAAGLACLSIGVLALFVGETVSLSVREGAGRNPADAHPVGQEEAKKPQPKPKPTPFDASVAKVIGNTPLPTALKANPLQGLARILACIAQIVLVIGLIAVGWRHFERPIAGLSVATCYLLLPYSRFALVDSGQLVPAALIVTALLTYRNPAVAGMLIGFAAGWMPASIGLVPLWTGFYRGRGMLRFGLVSVGVLAGCVLAGRFVPSMSEWATALGARSLAEAGFWPNSEPPPVGSFWSGIDSSYRLPVWIAYLALVVATTFWPAEKNLGELIATSAALLVASQFWYLASGGALALLYLPLITLMMFRPNLSLRRSFPVRPRTKRTRETVSNDA